MSKIVLNAIFDADACEIMGQTIYSTNPRELITIEDMMSSFDED